eukprot:g6153.t1
MLHAIKVMHNILGLAETCEVPGQTNDRVPHPGGWLALACQRDQHDRPTHGFVNFCPAQLPELSDTRWGSTLATALHEIAHVLGFSAASFALMRDANLQGAPRTPRDSRGLPLLRATACADGTRRVTERPPSAATMEVSGDGRTARIVTPRVQREARAQFACDRLTGAELENQPTAGAGACWGAHWEERLFRTDMMSAVESTAGAGANHIMSRVTLAYFEDTGWYKANYGLAQAAHWGYRAGCSFAMLPCLDGSGATPSPSEPRHFCATPEVEQCGVGRTARGYCAIVDHNRSLPARFQYFKGHTRRGGDVRRADYCPTARSWANGDCRNGANKPGRNYYGQTFGPASRCFKSSLHQRVAVSGNTFAYVEGATLGTACHEMRCNADGSLSLRLAVDGGQSQWLRCTSGRTVSGVTGFDGELHCPANASTEICLPEFW